MSLQTILLPDARRTMQVFVEDGDSAGRVLRKVVDQVQLSEVESFALFAVSGAKRTRLSPSELFEPEGLSIVIQPAFLLGTEPEEWVQLPVEMYFLYLYTLYLVCERLVLVHRNRQGRLLALLLYIEARVETLPETGIDEHMCAQIKKTAPVPFLLRVDLPDDVLRDAVDEHARLCNPSRTEERRVRNRAEARHMFVQTVHAFDSLGGSRYLLLSQGQPAVLHISPLGISVCVQSAPDKAVDVSFRDLLSLGTNSKGLTIVYGKVELEAREDLVRRGVLDEEDVLRRASEDEVPANDREVETGAGSCGLPFTCHCETTEGRVIRNYLYEYVSFLKAQQEKLVLRNRSSGLQQ